MMVNGLSLIRYKEKIAVGKCPYCNEWSYLRKGGFDHHCFDLKKVKVDYHCNACNRHWNETYELKLKLVDTEEVE